MAARMLASVAAVLVGSSSSSASASASASRAGARAGASASAAPQCTFVANQTGSDNLVVPVINGINSKEACCMLCTKQPGCGGWTWGGTVLPGTCFLRKPGTSWRRLHGAWSGTVTGPGPAFSVATVFSSDMILQRDVPVSVWGWTDNAGTAVTVEFNSKTYTASATGKLWKATLDTMPASATRKCASNI